MKAGDIPPYRLAAQQIGATSLQSPWEMVRWLGAVQAQDYAGGLWSLGLRLPKTTDRDIEKALNDRTIIRTWALRGTLHLIAAPDARWMLDLLAPGIIRKTARRHKELGLVPEDFLRSREIVRDALGGGRSLTRPALFHVLAKNGISPGGQRGYHILFRLGLEGAICFGPRERKQQTFVLFDDWVHEGGSLNRDEALTELARRYFTSHGPATVADFAWWSGLAAADARAGIKGSNDELVQQSFGGKTFWMTAGQEPYHARDAHLLQSFDEFFIAYRDRSDFLNRPLIRIAQRLTNFPFIIGGRAAGTWKKIVRKDELVVRTKAFSPLDTTDGASVSVAVMHYARFLGRHGVREEVDPGVTPMRNGG